MELIVGGWLTVTMMVKLCWAAAPCASVAATVTCATPTWDAVGTHCTRPLDRIDVHARRGALEREGRRGAVGVGGGDGVLIEVVRPWRSAAESEVITGG